MERRVDPVNLEDPVLTRSKRRVTAGAVAAGATVATLVWLTTGTHHVASPSAPSVTPKPTAAGVATKPPATAVKPRAGRPAAVGGGSGCHLPAGSQKVPSAAPPVRWELVDTVALPFSVTAGPEYVVGDVARCFAHDPAGALLAVSQISDRLVLSTSWARQVSTGVVPNAGARAFSQLMRGAPNRPASPGGACQLAGYSFLSYTPARASIALVGRCGGNLQVGTVTAVWYGGDWRLELLPDGGEALTATALASLVGYTPWGGV